MRSKKSVCRRAAARLLGACVLLAGGFASAVVMAGSAGAATCDAGTPCTVTGSADLGAGALNLTTPGSLGWAATLTGLAQHVVDTTTADQSYTVNDATGSGSGWNVTVDATTFTDSSSDTLADTGTFSTNGSTSLQASTTGPSSACTATGQCTTPTNAVTYPVAVTTAASSPVPSTIFSAAADSGIGSILVGGATPVGWWISLPGSTLAGTYTSTVDLNVATGP